MVIDNALTPTDDLLRALYRGSSLELDNLGIPVDVSLAHSRYASRIGKLPVALTSDESAQAILEYIRDDPALLKTLLRHLDSRKETCHAPDR